MKLEDAQKGAAQATHEQGMSAAEKERLESLGYAQGEH
jgi:hypothetical protein